MGAVDDCQSTVQSAINAQQIAKLVHWSELNAAAIDALPYSTDDDTEPCTARIVLRARTEAAHWPRER
eukprot:20994-Heterococcus_DN1.PRE.1